MSGFGQNTIKNYDAEWKRVKDYSERGLPKSALAEVNAIYERAKKEKQDAQIIKALVERLSLESELKENFYQSATASLKKEIRGASDPARAILYSLLADAYYSQYQSLRWQIMSRTDISGQKSEDASTWSATDFMESIGEYYLKSLENESLLKATQLGPLDAIITKGNSRHLRPTLYDLLVHKALEFFVSDERTISKPAYAFEIDQAEAFADASVFATASFATKDTLSLDYKAVKLYQKLLLFHLKDTDPGALIDADLARVLYVYRKSVHPEKEELYVAALQNIVQKYSSNPGSAQASYFLAQWYFQKANTYEPYGDTTHRYAAVTAYNLADSVSKRFPRSEGGVNLHNLKLQIDSKDITFHIERVNVPEKPILISLEYKNTTEVYFKLFKLTESLKEIQEREGQEKLLAALIREPLFKSWNDRLPETADFQNHRVELKADPFPVGEYYLLASTSSNLSDSEAARSMEVVRVSNISYVHQDNDYFVLHRETGQPLEGVKAQLWHRIYSNRISGYVRQKGAVYTTNKNGYFKLEPAENSSYFYLEFIGKSDRLSTDQPQYVSRRGNRTEEKEVQTMFFFTDRSIYRPGQTVYFKGILLNKKTRDKGSEVVSNHNVTVQLFDANAQLVDSLRLSTNEFGSMSGTFQLPSAGLNGQFRLAVSKINGQTNFSVEEYKRPRYKVDVEKPEREYRIGDTVTVSGEAKAFAGNTIDGAVVKYRVERLARFPYPWRFFRSWWPVSAPLQVAHGETTTNAEGRFNISFPAIPDKTILPENEPVFDYQIYVDVTDGSGETRSARQMVSVGYKTLVLQLTVPEKVESDSLSVLTVRTENTNGVFLPAEVALTVRKLVPESRLIRNREWERPDQFVLTKNEFIRFFPNDEYYNERDPAFWEKGEPIVTERKATQEDGRWILSDSEKLTPGIYELEFIATSANGETIKDVKIVEVIDSQNEKMSRPEYLWVKGSDPVEPGEKAEILLGTAADPLFVIQTIERPEYTKDSKSYQFLSKRGGIDPYTFTVSEEDRGGFGVNFLFVRHNRVYQYQDVITVPWSSKELAISYGTFRDKTRPGSEETWTLTIAGSKGEKVTAELLAGMYDASLDEFRSHQWQKPGVWQNFFRRYYWSTNAAFGQELSDRIYSADNKGFRDFAKIYDWLISFYEALDRVVVTGYGGRREIQYSMRASAEVREEASFNAPQMEKAVQLTDQAAEDNQIEAEKGEQVDQPTRKDFRETAFFFPLLQTNPDGSVTFSFTMPEALTKWKFQALSHTKELAFGYSTQEIVTQKELMVQPNIPRFVRVRDEIAVSTKVVNLSDKALSGSVRLNILDAATGTSLDEKFGMTTGNVSFTTAPGQSTSLHFPVVIPNDILEPVTIRIVAAAGTFSDGEDNVVPILTNQMLVTETLPLSLRGTGTGNFSFDKLLKSKPGGTLKNHALTVEYTGNPAWYAVQALPYLMEYPYDCAEQTWNRYYANALATHIVNSSPRIEQIFKTWRDLDTSALLSNLQKNQELKSLLLEETPWVLAAKSEAEQKQNLALLFDLVKMKNEATGALAQLQQMQRPEGSFAWFKGGPDDRFVTQYILTGIGHLYRLAEPDPTQKAALDQVVRMGLEYLDSKLAADYEQLVKSKASLKKHTLSPIHIQYFYMRSFFPRIQVSGNAKKAHGYYLSRLPVNWANQNKYLQAMTALTLSRSGNKKVADAVMKSLKETAIQNAELGTYWKSVRRSWWWQEAPIEQHALLVEAFEEVTSDKEMADGIRTWLLTNKRTNRWESTKATAEATYALLLRGTDWLNDNPEVRISLGGQVLSSEEGAEAGTGYLKILIPGPEVSADQGKIQVTVTGSEAAKNRPSWGGVYWQYFEDLDKITFSETPLKLKKQLFVETNSDRGPVLKEIAGGSETKVGDKLKVRVVLTVDRDMEYVHMKDMRASGLEPVNVLSSYKWQGGVSYYESTRDAATNFFFNYLPKGTYVFEYPLNVTHQGDFSNGVTTIQCMYAPEFTAHSEGIRLIVGK